MIQDEMSISHHNHFFPFKTSLRNGGLAFLEFGFTPVGDATHAPRPGSWGAGRGGSLRTQSCPEGAGSPGNPASLPPDAASPRGVAALADEPAGSWRRSDTPGPRLCRHGAPRLNRRASGVFWQTSQVPASWGTQEGPRALCLHPGDQKAPVSESPFRCVGGLDGGSFDPIFFWP